MAASFKWGASLADNDPVHALTLSGKLPFVLSSAELAGGAFDGDGGDSPPAVSDVIRTLERAISHADGGASDVQAIAALCRMLLGVGEARRTLDALQLSEPTIVALIEKLTGAPAPAGRIDTARGRFALPLMLGTSDDELPAATGDSDDTEHAAPDTRIRARMLGRFEVTVDGTSLPAWRSRRARQLFQYLLLNAGEEVSRHRLMGIFWPDHNEERAENNLSLTVMTLRRVLEKAATGLGGSIVFRSGAYLLDSSALWLDVDEFDNALERGRSLDKAGDAAGAAEGFDAAIGLYGGDLLPGDLYEEWTHSRRQRLTDRFLEALQRRAVLARMDGDLELSIRLNQRAIEVDPALEAAHRQLVLDYLETGQRSRAAQQVEACRDALRRHLGEEPDSESIAVFARVTAQINRESIADQR